MELTLLPEEPAAGPWRAVRLPDLASHLLDLSDRRRAGRPPGVGGSGRPRVIAVDGRGGSGKSTLAATLARAIPDAVVVHTDDLSWHEPLFGWGHLLAELILAPLHRGETVRARPPAWRARGRKGVIEVPPGTKTVIVEGNGAGQRAVAELLDASVWVQADFAEAERRGIARDVESGENGDATEAAAFWHEWQSREITFFAEDRPWERADVVVAGTTTIPLAVGEVAMAPGPPTRPERG